MNIARRWYIYIVALITLQSVTWALITLLRNLIVFGIDPLTVAFQIAVIIIGLPVFLGHWLWAQRLSSRDEDEKGSVVRRLYLYGSLAAFLIPFLTNLYDLFGTWLRAAGTLERRTNFSSRLQSEDAALYHLIGIVILALFWFYHQRMLQTESKQVPENEGAATVRRLYIFGFSAAGLTTVSLAVIHLIRLVMTQIIGDIIAGSDSLFVGLTDEVTRLLIGVPLWIIFWRWAGKLYWNPDPSEQQSVVRKFYLNAAVFIGTFGVVSYSTAILASLLRRLLQLTPEGDIRLPLPIIIGMAIVWAFHAMIIRSEYDEDQTSEQAGVLRLNRYLTAGIGYAAVLIGVGGILSVLIRSFDTGFIGDLREQLAWFTAGLVAGLPVWLLPFRILHGQVEQSGPAAGEARRSLPRKIYMYLFLLIGVLIVLSSGVFIVFRVLSMLLGEDPITLNELGHAIAFTFIAAASWIFHTVLLRRDSANTTREKVKEFEAIKIMVLDSASGQFGQILVRTLQAEIPGLALEPTIIPSPNQVPADPDTESNSETPLDHSQLLKDLVEADLIVGSWETMAAGSVGPTSEIAKAIADSPARKLLLPTPRPGVDWIGLENKSTTALAKEAAQAIEQILEGGQVGRKPLGCLAIGGILVGIVIVLWLLGALAEFFW